MSAVAGITRVLSFGRKPRSAGTTQVFNDGSKTTMPRLTPRLITPRTTKTMSFELERSSKTEPLGLQFAMVADYYSGVIITEASEKALSAGLLPGDCVNFVGSRQVTSVEDCEDSLTRIAGSVEVQVSRSKKLPDGWTAVEENGRKVLKLRTFQPTSERKKPQPQCELRLSGVTPGSRGVELTTSGKGQVVIHAVKKDSLFYKHIKVGDKLFQINGQDFASNPVGASRAMTGASGDLRIGGTFIAPTPECAATGCECCTNIFGKRCAPPTIAPKPAVCESVQPGVEVTSVSVEESEAEAEVAALEAEVEAEGANEAEVEDEAPDAVETTGDEIPAAFAGATDATDADADATDAASPPEEEGAEDEGSAAAPDEGSAAEAETSVAAQSF